MKVVYKKSILERIDEAIDDSQLNYKNIDKIILTEEEWKDLGVCLGPFVNYLVVPEEGQGCIIYRGVKIVKGGRG